VITVRVNDHRVSLVLIDIGTPVPASTRPVNTDDDDNDAEIVTVSTSTAPPPPMPPARIAQRAHGGWLRALSLSWCVALDDALAIGALAHCA
jgi:hypothetical protein